MGRGRSWLMEEDVALCRAYARSAAENPTDFFARMCFLFAESAPDDQEPDRWAHRSNKALEKRLKVIRPAVLRFCRHYGRAVAAARPHDGEADIVAQALASYAGARTNDKSKSASHPDNSFRYLECWHTLRNVPVFAGACKANDQLLDAELASNVPVESERSGAASPANDAAPAGGAAVQVKQQQQQPLHHRHHQTGSPAALVNETRTLVEGSEETTASDPSRSGRLGASTFPNLVVESLATSPAPLATSPALVTEGRAPQHLSAISSARLAPRPRKRSRTTLSSDEMPPPAIHKVTAGPDNRQRVAQNGRNGAHNTKQVPTRKNSVGSSKAPPSRVAASAPNAAFRPPGVEGNTARENGHFPFLSDKAVSQLVAIGERLVCLGEDMCGIAVFSRQDATPARQRQYFDLLEGQYLEASKRRRLAENVPPGPGTTE